MNFMSTLADIWYNRQWHKRWLKISWYNISGYTEYHRKSLFILYVQIPDVNCWSYTDWCKSLSFITKLWNHQEIFAWQIHVTEWAMCWRSMQSLPVVLRRSTAAFLAANSSLSGTISANSFWSPEVIETNY